MTSRRRDGAVVDGDFPDKAFMRSIIEHNLSEALALLP
jgi:hypothetical protein